jgi:RimJ/RimL family protein N-acetyltransferase
MPSLADVPDLLMNRDRKHDFLYWLADLPAALHESRALMRLWAAATDSTFDHTDWNFITRRKQGDYVKP